jgi:uncharacterized protein DUF4349
MRWSNRHDDNLDALLREEGKLGAALTELRERRPEPPEGLRERVQTIAAEEGERDRRRTRAHFLPSRVSPARVGALAAAVLVVAVAIPAVATIARDGATRATADESAAHAESLERDRLRALTPPPPPPPPLAPSPTGGGPGVAPPPPPPPPAAEDSRSEGLGAPGMQVAPLPSQSRAQDYSARIKLHVNGHDELSEAVQSAIRTTRRLGGYVTYVDYGTSGREDGAAELAVRIPVGRVQAAVAAFSELGTILEQKTEIVDLQGRIDRITRELQLRRDRIAKIEAELKDPTLTETERNRLEARLVQAKRGLAQATQERAGVIRQSRFAKLDLAFTTVDEREAPPPPGRVERMLDDAVGVLLAELAIVLYALIVAAPLLLLAALGWLGARSLRRASNDRLLEAS